MNRAAKKLRGRIASQAATASRSWALTELMTRVVVIAFMLTDGVADPGVVYLLQHMRIQHWKPEKSEDEVASIVRDSFIATDIDEIAALCDEGSPLDPAAYAEAVRFVEEWRVVDWTVAQNKKGIALPSSMLLDQKERRRGALPAHARPPPWGSSMSASSRKRVSRLRERWHGRIATIRPRDVMTAEEMHQKALSVARFPLYGHVPPFMYSCCLLSCAVCELG